MEEKFVDSASNKNGELAVKVNSIVDCSFLSKKRGKSPRRGRCYSEENFRLPKIDMNWFGDDNEMNKTDCTGTKWNRKSTLLTVVKR